MSASAETVLRRIRNVLGTPGLERLNPGGVRLVLGKVLFDGDGIPDWHQHAACQKQTPSYFSPIPTTFNGHRARSEFCAGCPVRSACLGYVMAWEQPSHRCGVVGGLSAQERRQLHRATRESANSGEAA
jgi:hypothetical protein